MGVINFVLLLLNVVSALVIVGLVLMQHGKGADAGATFGSGASGSLFGATGSANFLSRMTSGAATLWFISCIAMVAIGSHSASKAPASNVLNSLINSKAPVVKVLPGKPAASHVVPE